MRLAIRTLGVACALATATTALTWVGSPARTTAKPAKSELRTPQLANPYPAECLEPVDAPDGEGLIVTSEKNRMFISTLDGQVIRRPSEWARLPVAWSPDARYIVEGPEGQIYSVEGDRRLDRLRHKGVGKKVRWGFSPIANCILDVPARYPGALGVTVLGNDSISHSATLLFKEGVYSFAFSPDGRRLAVYMHDGARYGIYIVELASGEVHDVHHFAAGRCCFNFAGWTADGEDVLYWARPSGPIPGGGWVLEGVGTDGINETYAQTMVPDPVR